MTSTVKLDPSRLLGYRLVATQAAKMGQKEAPSSKLGEKLGQKPTIGARLGTKDL